MMKTAARTRRDIARIAFVLVIAALPLAASAEVGAIIGDPEPTWGPSPYIINGITEDPEPIWGYAWRQYNFQTSQHAVLNPGGEANLDGYPSILRNPTSSLPIVAWARNSAQGYDVVVTHYDDDEWKTPYVVADTPDDELDPHLVLDPSNGDVHLFWWVDDGAPKIMHSVAPADLSSWSTPAQVSQSAEEACRPHGVFHDGELYVAYEVHDYGFEQTPRQIVLSRREGSTFVPEVVAITHNGDEVRPEVHSHSGRIWVDWIDSDAEMGWTRKDLQGQWEPLQYEPYLSIEERDYLVRGGIRMQAIE